MIYRPDHSKGAHTVRDIDLSTNVPYNESLRREISDMSRHINPFNYPRQEIFYKKLSDIYSLPIEQLTIGHGATEIIERLVRVYSDKTWYIIHPTFEMVEVYCKIYGVRYELVSAEDSIYADRSNSILYYASPNGLTGKSLTIDKSDWFLVVNDNVYGEFCDQSQLDIPEQNEVIIRSFSKSLGLAGLRLGWCCASLKVTKLLQNVRSNHPVNSYALELIAQVMHRVDSVNIDWAEGKDYLENMYDTVSTDAAFVLFRKENAHTRKFGCKKTPEGLYRMAVANKEILCLESYR